MSQAAPSKSGATVWVGCKLVHGLEIFDEEEGLSHDANPKKISVRVPGTTVKLNGANSSKVIGGYGRTEVSQDFWDKWHGTHKKFPPVVSGAIFVEGSRERFAAAAADRKSIKTGFEPIDPTRPGEGVVPDPDAERRARERVTPLD